MKLPRNITVHVGLDDIETVIDEIKALQTYKLYERDEALLVDRADVAEVLARHVKAEMSGRRYSWITAGDQPRSFGRIRSVCPNCGAFALHDFVNVGSYKEKLSNYCPNCGLKLEDENDVV